MRRYTLNNFTGGAKDVAMAGVYCQPCLDRETAGMGSDELFQSEGRTV